MFTVRLFSARCEGVPEAGLLPSAWSKVLQQAFTLHQLFCTHFTPVPLFVPAASTPAGPPLSSGPWILQVFTRRPLSPPPHNQLETLRTWQCRRDRRPVSAASCPRARLICRWFDWLTHAFCHVSVEFEIAPALFHSDWKPFIRNSVCGFIFF